MFVLRSVKGKGAHRGQIRAPFARIIWLALFSRSLLFEQVL
jgi:hypothetical protein